MIKDIPTHLEFEKLGLQCISKAFEMLYEVGNRYAEIVEENVITEEVTEEIFWNHNNITVRTSLIVLFQGIEYLMKGKVTEQSALLLIENNRTDWPSLPDKKDKNFDEMQTISGENLLSVFCAITPIQINLGDFVKQFEELRLKRNKLVHSTGVETLNYKYVVEKILFFLSEFYSKDRWVGLFREMFTSEPTFGYWDADVEGAYFYRVLNFVEASLTKGQINKFLNYDIKARRYLCPECTYWLNKHEFNGTKPKWGFLKPNTPDSTIIDCLICGKEYNIERKDCKCKLCKGNVINSDTIEDLCLSCYNEEE